MSTWTVTTTVICNIYWYIYIFIDICNNRIASLVWALTNYSDIAIDQHIFEKNLDKKNFREENENLKKESMGHPTRLVSFCMKFTTTLDWQVEDWFTSYARTYPLNLPLTQVFPSFLNRGKISHRDLMVHALVEVTPLCPKFVYVHTITL